jgi:hypothetical protein
VKEMKCLAAEEPLSNTRNFSLDNVEELDADFREIHHINE